MRRAGDRAGAPIRVGFPGLLVAGLVVLGGLALASCQPGSTPTGVVPPSGAGTFRPSPTPVPGTSFVPPEQPGGGAPQPTLEVPPPIP